MEFLPSREAIFYKVFAYTIRFYHYYLSRARGAYPQVQHCSLIAMELTTLCSMRRTSQLASWHGFLISFSFFCLAESD